MSLNHNSYEKIPESFEYWQLTEADYRALKKVSWVVTEKIHGANFCVITDGKEVSFAKRKELLSPEEDFFGFYYIKDQLTEQALNIYKILFSKDSRILSVSIYGELFGGEYPHPEIKGNPQLQAIQTGVYYTNAIAYAAFDIALQYPAPQHRVYLDYDASIKLFQQVGMFYAHPLFIGKYSEALAYNIEFPSTIPALLGLPPLPSPNKAEGLVIKPIKTISIDTPKGKIRPIIKRKISEFAEDSRYHQAQKWTQRDYHSTTSEAEQQMLSLVTPTRINNVISKLGRVSKNNPKTKQQLTELLIEDVLESFAEMYPNQWETMTSKQQYKLKSQLKDGVKALIEQKY